MAKYFVELSGENAAKAFVEVQNQGFEQVSWAVENQILFFEASILDLALVLDLLERKNINVIEFGEVQNS